MKYLIRNKGKVKIAHFWSESKRNTECLMYSNGGMRKENYSIFSSDLGAKICLMCKNNRKISNAEYREA